MKKIISLFERDYEGTRLVINKVVPGAEWVIEGEGIATEKIDGTCCLIKDGRLFKRYDAKHGKKPPKNFIPAQDPDPVTGHWPGWLLVGDGSEDQWHREGLADLVKGFGNRDGKLSEFCEGTHELIGPKIQGNPYCRTQHLIVKHGLFKLTDANEPPRDFEGLKKYLLHPPRYFAGGFSNYFEGIVWHHPDGRMVKIKRRDFYKK